MQVTAVRVCPSLFESVRVCSSLSGFSSSQTRTDPVHGPRSGASIRIPPRRTCRFGSRPAARAGSDPAPPPNLVRVGNARGLGLRQAMSAFEARAVSAGLDRAAEAAAAVCGSRCWWGSRRQHVGRATPTRRPRMRGRGRLWLWSSRRRHDARVCPCACVCSRAATVNVVTVTGVTPAVLVYLCSRASQQPAPTRLPRLGGRGYVAADTWPRVGADARRRMRGGGARRGAHVSVRAGCARVGEGRVRTCR